MCQSFQSFQSALIARWGNRRMAGQSILVEFTAFKFGSIVSTSGSLAHLSVDPEVPCMPMELPDEAITYHYQALLAPVGEEWTAAAELRARHFVSPAASEGPVAPADAVPQPGGGRPRDAQRAAGDACRSTPAFIDLPQATARQPSPQAGRQRPRPRLDPGRRSLREEADRVVFLGIGGSLPGCPRRSSRRCAAVTTTNCRPKRASACRASISRAITPTTTPCRNLLDLLQITCVDPDQREDAGRSWPSARPATSWSRASALRVFRREATEYYGLRSPWLTRAVRRRHRRRRASCATCSRRTDMATIRRS